MKSIIITPKNHSDFEFPFKNSCDDYGFCPIMERGIEKGLIIQRQDYMNHYAPWKFVKTRSKA